MNFNPLPPHGGRRRSVACLRPECHFNPLPPHGGRPVSDLGGVKTHAISIHSLRMEGDRPAGCWTIHRTSFQSTPSAWRETREFQEFFESSDISIHSLRMEGDIRAGIPDAQDSTISIHSLRMEGDSREPTSSGKSIAFQSTPSAWRETHK